jgi:hypothetical protein
VVPTGTTLLWNAQPYTSSQYTPLTNGTGTFTVPATGIYLINLETLIQSGVGNGGYATICVTNNSTICYSLGNNNNSDGAGGVCYMSSASATVFLTGGGVGSATIVVKAGAGYYDGAILDSQLTTLTITLLTRIQL